MEERIKKPLIDLFAAGRLQGKEAVDAETWTREIDMAYEAILTAVAESLPPAKSDKGVFKLDYEVVAEIYGWNAYRNEVLAQLGKEK